jgi:hypothetical protein
MKNLLLAHIERKVPAKACNVQPDILHAAIPVDAVTNTFVPPKLSLPLNVRKKSYFSGMIFLS